MVKDKFLVVKYKNERRCNNSEPRSKMRKEACGLLGEALADRFEFRNHSNSKFHSNEFEFILKYDVLFFHYHVSSGWIWIIKISTMIYIVEMLIAQMDRSWWVKSSQNLVWTWLGSDLVLSRNEQKMPDIYAIQLSFPIFSLSFSLSFLLLWTSGDEGSFREPEALKRWICRPEIDTPSHTNLIVYIFVQIIYVSVCEKIFLSFVYTLQAYLLFFSR